ncbi:cilia- and flagella-associated protein 43-like [Prorops nasuta]|uniref:cilia- and flagella-associated protein 43-like n=1 Tax=Prorops nasuta TaxID=863751 RepID=UPI0034CDC289
MIKSNWKPSWIRGSRIDEIIWIGKDVLAWCSGLCIIFYKIGEKRQGLLWCPDQSTGEGACCLSGHATVPIFAFSEKRTKPRILVLAYPSMKKISECSRDSPSGYLATAFTANDHIVALEAHPSFRMIIWSWRTGERIIEVETAVRDREGQILRITQSGPTFLAQLGKTSGELFTWEVDILEKLAILRDHRITLPEKAEPFSIDWRPGPEALMAISDRNGHIYLSNYNGSKIFRIVFSQRCDLCPEYELPAVHWFKTGIVLRTTFCQIRYYKRDPKSDRWYRAWYVKSSMKPCLLVVHPHKTDRFFYHTLEGFLMQIDFPEEQDTPVLQKQLYYGGFYKQVDFVYPWCHHVVAIDDFKQLTIIERYSGLEVSSFVEPYLRGHLNTFLSHPEQPIFALITSAGELLLVSLADPEEPRVAARVQLHRAPLDFLKFSYRGKYLLVGEKSTGICFCLSVLDEDALNVLCRIETRRRITDATLLESSSSVKVVISIDSSKQAGHYFLLYDITGEQSFIKNPTSTLKSKWFCKNIYQLPDSSQVLIGSPSISGKFTTFKLQDWKSLVNLDTFASGHSVRRASVFTDQNWTSTAAMDGLVTIRDKNLKEAKNVLMTHHRKDLGVRKAIVTPRRDCVIALGYNGSLVAMMKNHGKEDSDDIPKIHPVDPNVYNIAKDGILAVYESMEEIVKNLLMTENPDLIRDNEEDEKTWVEWRNDKTLADLDREYFQKKKLIRDDLFALKSELKNLLDMNDASPKIEKLPISNFDLDLVARENKMIKTREEAEELRQQLEEQCVKMGQVFNWIKLKFWDEQIILGQSIFELFDRMEVDNYPMVAEDRRLDDELKWAQFSREAMRKILENGTLEAWVPCSENDLRDHLCQPIRIHQEDERQRMDELLEEEEEEEISMEEVEEERACSGMTTHRYVEPCPNYYSQLESNGFIHVLHNNHFLLKDGRKLRNHFNSLFDDMAIQKRREVETLHGMNKKLTHISSELKKMFGKKMQGPVAIDYEWRQKERPESIVQVLDNEVKVKPYITASQQEMLDKEALEAERIRLLLLADDFRERALMAMMDGVLEVRWEDIIKRDVPKPECMLRKKPEQYNADDIATMKKYRKDVDSLNEERLRYKRILENDYAKTWAARQEVIDRFNLRLQEFLVEKLKIEASLHQLNLRYSRGCLRNVRRVAAIEKDMEMKRTIAFKKNYVTVMEAHLEELDNFSKTVNSRYEGLCSFERAMGKRLKQEFQSFGKLIVGHLENLYNRRPRMTLRLSASDLIDLGEHACSGSKPIHLPASCAEYLRLLDNLDVRPTNLPEAIGANHWQSFCQLRRQKIEVELRIRAHSMELTEVERKINIFNGKITKLKARLGDLREQLIMSKKKQDTFDQNIEIQLVLKMGQIEVSLRGCSNDCESCAFIPCSAIDGVNQLISAAGNRKINAMNRIVQFGRGILFKEWKHEMLKLELEFLKEELEEVKRIRVTIEIRKLLKSKIAKDGKTKKSDAERMLQEHERAIQKEERSLKRFHEEFRKSLNIEVAKLVGIGTKIASMKKKNALLDKLITESNLKRCEMEEQRDTAGEERQRRFNERKMQILLQRSSLVRKLQANYIELLSLQTQHNLLRSGKSPGCFRLPRFADK